MLVRMWSKGNPCVLLVGIFIMGTATMENSIDVHQEINNGMTIPSRDSTSGCLLEEKPY